MQVPCVLYVHNMSLKLTWWHVAFCLLCWIQGFIWLGISGCSLVSPISGVPLSGPPGSLKAAQSSGCRWRVPDLQSLAGQE